MNIQNKTATIFGGTGFIGRQVVRELAALGYTIKVASRVPERAYFLRPCGTVGQIVPIQCNYNDDKSIQAAVKGSDFVVNCIGILYEKGKSKFDKVHHELPKSIAKACKKENVESFAHISALGVEQSNAKYAKSKLAGEKAVRKAFPNSTILRPSIVFGPEDNFFNQFAELSRYLPALPLIGGGKTQFQPVYVGDVADAVVTSIQNKNTNGNTYEIGGPDVLTFKQLFQKLFDYTDRKRMLINLPFPVAKIEGRLLSLAPKPLLTADQVELLKTDNIVSKNAKTLSDLDIEATSLDVILPQYLTRFKSGEKVAETAY